MSNKGASYTTPYSYKGKDVNNLFLSGDAKNVCIKCPACLFKVWNGTDSSADESKAYSFKTSRNLVDKIFGLDYEGQYVNDTPCTSWEILNNKIWTARSDQNGRYVLKEGEIQSLIKTTHSHYFAHHHELVPAYKPHIIQRYEEYLERMEMKEERKQAAK